MVFKRSEEESLLCRLIQASRPLYQQSERTIRAGPTSNVEGTPRTIYTYFMPCRRSKA